MAERLEAARVKIDRAREAVESDEGASPVLVAVVNEFGRAGHHPVLETLTPAQCETRLAAGEVGRIVYSSGRGPVALPVNFKYTDGEVVLSTDVSKASALESEEVVGFEIDRVDEAMSEGWNVLVTGRARRIDDPDECVRLASLDLEAWAGGARYALIAIKPDELTGRVIVHRSMPNQD
jgi:nitroimidazol reductase NimA-like FMN-containing flavoprotein (pyridoxamine 5'-phosphate oxidase superfamily)